MNEEFKDISLMVEVARLYYEHDYSQVEIAKKLGVSRPKVSRLLKKARENGIVRVEIRDPYQQGTVLEAGLAKEYGLIKVIVVPTDSDSGVVKKRLGFAASRLLDELVQEGEIVGVSWGTTMHQVALQLSDKFYKNLTVVQLNGGISRAEFDTRATETVRIIGEKLHARTFLLPLPAIVENEQVKKAILEDNNIAHILDLGRKARIAVYTIGSFNEESVLVKAEYFDQKEVKQLLDAGAVADICSRIINKEGDPCSEELNDRTIGIDLNDLKQKEYAIAVAGGAEKLEAIRAALKGGYCNVLITDEFIAHQLLD